MKTMIDQLHQIAEERGGECLSDRYIKADSKYLWECAKGHQWKAVPGNIKQGTWCPYCSGNTKQTIEDMQQIAKDRNGKCLSIAYKNSASKLLWECKKGHQWEAAPSAVKGGTWCPHCAKKIKRTIEEMHQIAKENGGRCLSKSYKDTHTKLLWECKDGHQWEAAPVGIRLHGRWCPTCAGVIRHTIEDMQKIAKERGGKCLSDKYTNNVTKLLWECAEGHRWEAIPSSILSGSWCRKCYLFKKFHSSKQEFSK